ncbi:uncharacterized protein LOC144436179 [Glandiceps talaboti]
MFDRKTTLDDGRDASGSMEDVDKPTCRIHGPIPSGSRRRSYTVNEAHIEEQKRWAEVRARRNVASYNKSHSKSESSVNSWLPNVFRKWHQQRSPTVYWSQTRRELPVKYIAELSEEVLASYSAPNGGITNVPGADKRNGIAGVDAWDKKHDRAYGIATSLYEYNHCNKIATGDPVADVLAICARKNSCILIIADGVNWGDKPRLAARCAVHACMEYLNKKLYSNYCQIDTTQDILQHMKEGFREAQNFIMREEGTMTTLTATVVAQLKGSTQYAVCTLNVGDSLGFIYNKQAGVRELTVGSRNPNVTRDMKLCGGALGPVDGINPDLTNLTYSLTIAEAGDVVYLTTDGVSDNFDPVVAHRAMSVNPIKFICSCPPATVELAEKIDMEALLPVFDERQRQHDSLKHMEMALLTMESPHGDDITASDVCAKLLQYAVNKTEQKRKRLEQMSIDNIQKNPAERRQALSEMSSIFKGIPGKLDHAAVVAFQIGQFQTKSKSQQHQEISEVTRHSADIDEDSYVFLEPDYFAADYPNTWPSTKSFARDEMYLQQYL